MPGRSEENPSRRYPRPQVASGGIGSDPQLSPPPTLRSPAGSAKRPRRSRPDPANSARPHESTGPAELRTAATPGDRSWNREPRTPVALGEVERALPARTQTQYRWPNRDSALQWTQPKGRPWNGSTASISLVTETVRSNLRSVETSGLTRAHRRAARTRPSSLLERTLHSRFRVSYSLFVRHGILAQIGMWLPEDGIARRLQIQNLASAAPLLTIPDY